MATLDMFLEHGAISQEQHDKSLHDLTEKMGYSRCARIVDQLEELGIVGPYEGAKPRSVLMNHEELSVLFSKIGMETDDVESD